MSEDPYDAADRELGAVLTAWVERHRGRFRSLDLHGPLPAPGMDPTWWLRLTGTRREVELFVFRGPVIEIGWFDVTESVPESHVEGHEELDRQAFLRVLDQLGDAANGA